LGGARGARARAKATRRLVLGPPVPPPPPCDDFLSPLKKGGHLAPRLCVRERTLSPPARSRCFVFCFRRSSRRRLFGVLFPFYSARGRRAPGGRISFARSQRSRRAPLLFFFSSPPTIRLRVERERAKQESAPVFFSNQPPRKNAYYERKRERARERTRACPPCFSSVK
jgi:hypothetical protein